MTAKPIKWINLQPFGEKISNDSPYYDKSIPHKLIDDLAYMGESKGYGLIYAPLAARLYAVPIEYISSKNPIEFVPEALKELVNSQLLLPAPVANSLLAEQEQFYDDGYGIRILMTSKCNLQCKYCYADASGSGKMVKLEDIQALIDFLPQDLRLIANLHGNGEPTLAMPLIKEAVKIIRGRYPDATITTQSNGLFSKTTADWLINNHVNVGFSMDGPEHIHNAHRPSPNPKVNGFKKMIENFERFRPVNKSPGCVTVISAFSLPYMEEIYYFLRDLGLKYIKFDPVIGVGRGKQYESPLNQPPDNDEFLRRLTDIRLKGYMDKVDIDSDFLLSVHLRRINPVRCSAGRPKYVLTADGDITSCAASLEIAAPDKNPFFIGKIKDGNVALDAEKINILHDRTVDNMPNCKTCELKWLCSGSCMVENYITNGNIYQPIENDCDTKKKYTRKYFQLLAESLL